jgi:hypothetical protein
MTFSRCSESEFRWRRVAVFRPVQISCAGVSQLLQRSVRSCHTGIRVLLRHEPTSHDRNRISVFVNRDRRIGTLPTEIAEWVAPLLDSGRVAFDAEIWPVDRTESEHAQDADACRLMLTQHELAPIRRLSLSAWWSREGRSFLARRLAGGRLMRRRELSAYCSSNPAAQTSCRPND